MFANLSAMKIEWRGNNCMNWIVAYNTFCL